MSHLKIKFVDFEKALAFQILEMDEDFRSGFDEDVKEFTASNEFVVNSSMYPDLFDGDIFLRGENKSSDFDVIVKQFLSNSERDKYKTNVLFALKEWSERWFSKTEKSFEISEKEFEF